MIEFSYQQYSSRKFLPWTDTFTMLSELGYTQVEGFGMVYDDASSIREALDKSNLTMPTAHFSLQMLEDEPDRVLELTKVLGINTVYCPFLLPDERPATADGYTEFGARLNQAGKFCLDAGLGYGWHNHDFEFLPLDDGSTPMQRIFAAAPDLGWEADIAWIIRGGADPVEWIQREGSRISSVHIKDIAPAGECADEDGWADVGQGTVDWKKLMTLLGNTNVQYYIMEHDNPSDDRRFARTSIDFCNSIQGNT